MRPRKLKPSYRDVHRHTQSIMLAACHPLAARPPDNASIIMKPGPTPNHMMTITLQRCSLYRLRRTKELPARHRSRFRSASRIARPSLSILQRATHQPSLQNNCMCSRRAVLFGRAISNQMLPLRRMDDRSTRLQLLHIANTIIGILIGNVYP